MTEQDSSLSRFFRPSFLVRPSIFLLYASMIVVGGFDRLESYGVLQYSFLALLLVLVLFETVELVEKSEDQFRIFTLGLWLLLATRVAVQAAGAADSHLYPLSYLLFAVLASVTGIGYMALLWLAFTGIEAGWTAVSGGPHMWTGVAVHGVFTAVFAGVAGGFVQMERKGRIKAERVFRRLEKDVSEFQRDDTVYKLAGLSDDGRRRQSMRSLRALDEAFHNALETGRVLLEADTCALYWQHERGQPFSLREIVSARNNVTYEEAINPGEGLLGWAIAQGRPLRASGERIRNAVPYYRPGHRAGHLMAAPVISGDEVRGVLAVDREGEAFSQEEEKLLSVLANQIKEIHGNALLMKRVEAEASQFKSLAELSHRLSRTLELEPILEAVMRTSRAISGHRAAAIVLSMQEHGYEELSLARVGGEMDPATEGAALDRETLAGWVVSESQHLLVREMSARSKKTPVLGKRLDPPSMESVLVQPLPFRCDARGALVFFEKEPDAFSPYVVRATGILADIAAVSIHNAILYRKMERRAVTDGLTGLYNHGWFQEQLSLEIERAERLGNRVSLVMADIDHFKRINDGYGHPVGDQVLKAVARVLNGSIRKVDSASRYGGEEFALLLAGADCRGAAELAERIRKKTARLVFQAGDREFGVTLSMGIASWPQDASNKEDLIKMADQALYRAKQSGRNRTVLFRDLETRAV